MPQNTAHVMLAASTHMFRSGKQRVRRSGSPNETQCVYSLEPDENRQPCQDGRTRQIFVPFSNALGTGCFVEPKWRWNIPRA